MKAIQILAKEQFFNELEFRIIGDGPLFEETVEPLRKYRNIEICRGFLTQTEIAKLHKEYGIFLCPTRMDSQGVSRDEAMASGLVPVTNSVAAIPEFVNDKCGILAAAEDFTGMANGIADLVRNPNLFDKLSCAASTRVRNQSDHQKIISQELDIIQK